MWKTKVEGGYYAKNFLAYVHNNVDACVHFLLWIASN